MSADHRRLLFWKAQMKPTNFFIEPNSFRMTMLWISNISHIFLFSCLYLKILKVVQNYLYLDFPYASPLLAILYPIYMFYTPNSCHNFSSPPYLILHFSHCINSIDIHPVFIKSNANYYVQQWLPFRILINQVVIKFEKSQLISCCYGYPIFLYIFPFLVFI